MERVLVSRQPIYNADMREFAYELLYRDSSEDRAEFSDEDQATAKVILNTFEIGLEELAGPHAAFINFGRNLILGNQCESLPKDRVVLELVDSTEPSDELLRRLAELKEAGYRISVDSAIGTQRFHDLLETAHFVRFDVTANPFAVIEHSIDSIRKYPAQWIAGKVETHEQFERCRALGFNFFQGYFFCKPKTVEGKRIPVNRLSTLRLIAALNDPQIKMNDVETAISRDVRLSYKLLRYANSAMVGLQRPVESIRHAIVLIGLEKIRIWASLLLLSGFDGKPRDIIVTGAVRARMCEQLARAQGAANSDKLFLVGMFSVLDGIVDQPLGSALASLPLNPAVADAILHQKGEFGAILKCVLAYERQDWVEARAGLNLPPEVIRQAYVDAVAWSLRTLQEFSTHEDSGPMKEGKGGKNSRRAG